MFVLIEEIKPLKLYIFNQPLIKFKTGNHQIGFKTKYRFEYDRFIEILENRELHPIGQYSVNGIKRDET